jgi:hypothetical protein
VPRERIAAGEKCSLIQFAYGRTGSMFKAARVVGFVIAWKPVRDDLGREPTIEEYSEWWGQPVRTCFKHFAEFREVFDRADPPVWPGEVLDMIGAYSGGVESARLDWSSVPVVA